MKYITTLLLCVTFIANTSAQSYKIAGMVQAKDNEAIPYVNVSLLDKNKKWIQTATTDEAGKYVLTDVGVGQYVIDVHVLGYEKYQQEISVNADVHDLNIELATNAEQIDEVTVKGRRMQIQTELGKTILNVSKEMKAGKNLLDLLGDVPGVIVSPAGDVSIVGKEGVTLIIDKKPVHFTGRSLTEYLKSVDASKVNNIELMTNPSAKYDATGNSGVIAINMEEQEDNGLYGGVNSRYIQGMYPFGSLSGNVNYKKDKLGLHITPSSYVGQSFLIDKRITTSKNAATQEHIAFVEEDGFLLEEYEDYLLDIATDYDFSKATTASASIKGVYHPNDQVDKYQSKIFDGQHLLNATNLSKTERGFLRKNVQANMFVNHDIDSGNSIVMNADYFRESKKIYQRFESVDYGVDGVQQTEPLRLNVSMPINSEVYSVKVDYEGEIAGIDIEAGSKTSFVRIDDPNLFEIYKDGEWVNDSLRTNNYQYDENISAAYVSAAAQKGKWQAKAGMRLERTAAKGREIISNGNFDRTYTNVFPTAYVAYKVDEKNSIEANFGKRIQRPYYRELNPFTLFVSQYNYAVGNPNLLPMFTNNIELKHSYRSRFITKVSYSIVNGVFTREISFEKVNNVSRFSTTNNGRKRTASLSIYANSHLNEWWDVTFNGNVFHHMYDGYFAGNDVSATSTGVYAQVDTQLRFKNGWYAKCGASYLSPFRTAAVNTHSGWISTNAQISKTMFKDTSTIVLSVSDPFGIYRTTEGIELPHVSTVSSPIYNVRNFALSFSYNFGKKDNDNRQKSRLEEAGRI